MKEAVEEETMERIAKEEEKVDDVSKEEVDKTHLEKPVDTIYRPIIPYLQRLKGVNTDFEFHKFINILNSLRINIPFVDIILQVPFYVKFLKEIITWKRKFEDHEVEHY